MRRVLLGGVDLLTSDVFGRALLDFAVLLGTTGSTGVATIAAVDSDGRAVRARILLGPAIPLVVLDADSEHPEPVDDEALRELSQAGRPGPTSAAWELPFEDFDVFGLPGDWDEPIAGTA